jgi:hypothetical protein
VVQLEEAVAVERHDREAVAPLHAELLLQRRRQPQAAVDVAAERGLVAGVEHRRPGRHLLGRRKQHPLVDELLHRAPLCRAVLPVRGAV